jgi:HYDIN/CFA65/VesB family protein
MGTEYVGKRSTPGKLVMTNTGSGPLAISSIVVAGLNSTNFAFTDNCPASLAAGASCTLTIYLQPTATGTRSGEIIIYDNAGAGNQTVTLTGTGLANP